MGDVGQGQRALVTGASGGIGLELARILAADGYSLTLVARSAAKLDALAGELGGAQVLAADLATPGAVDTIVASTSDVDVLVNNAGVGAHTLDTAALSPRPTRPRRPGWSSSTSERSPS